MASVTTIRHNRWSPAIILLYSGTGTITITVSSNTVEITDGTFTGSTNYVGRTIQSVVGDLNNQLPDIFEVRTAIDIGGELLIANTLYHDPDDRTYDDGYVIRYAGHIIRYEENTVIQLKPPRSLSKFEPWYVNIGNGKFRVRFSDISFTSFPGINPNAVYTFSLPEFSDQDWSVNYGPPYKDIFGEIPAIVGFNPTVGTTVLRVSNTPIYYKNRNISIRIRGTRQPNSVTKYVDENNGLIYITQKISKDVPVTVDYTYKETNYIYDGIDLNVSINHNPLIIDSYVAFYIKPTAADGALISGGRAIFHEELNTSIAARSKVAKRIPTGPLSKVVYEPVIYLGAINVRQANESGSIDIIDTRTRGGGLFSEDVQKYRQAWRESEYFYDIGSWDGISIPGHGAVVLQIPKDRVAKAMSTQEIEQRATRDVALGIVPIIDYNYISINKPDWDFSDEENSDHMVMVF